MALKLEQKKAVVAEVKAMASEAVSAVVADYRGLTMSALTELRCKARDVNVKVRVVRNTLAKRAIQETGFACLDSVLSGPVILLFAMDHPGAAARLAKEFTKKHNKLDVTALAFEGNLMSADQLAMLASLPTYEEGISLLMAMMMAPLTQTARCMSETVGKLVRVTDAVAKQQDAA